MKILVFGGTRMIGKHLVNALISQGYVLLSQLEGLLGMILIKMPIEL